MTIEHVDFRRSNSRDWRMFRDTEGTFSILSIESRVLIGETLEHANLRCAEAFSQLTRKLPSPPTNPLFLVAGWEQPGPQTKSGRLIARKQGFWAHASQSKALPRGTQIEEFWETPQDGFGEGGVIECQIDQLAVATEFTRTSRAACIFLADSQLHFEVGLMAEFAKLPDVDSYAKGQIWPLFVPRAIALGFLTVRAAGWFDDRIASLDIFGPSATIDLLTDLPADHR